MVGAAVLVDPAKDHEKTGISALLASLINTEVIHDAFCGLPL